MIFKFLYSITEKFPNNKIATFVVVDFVKKIGPLLLLLICATPLLFTIGWQARQKVIRIEMKEALENDLVHILELRTQEIHWIEKDKELLIDGRLFDVKEIRENENGGYTVKGLFDDEETKLLEVVRRKLPDNESKQLTGKLFRLQLSLPNPEFNLLATSQHPIKSTCPRYSDRLLETVSCIIAPPPKV